MLKQSQKPEGYRELLVYKKADILLSDTLSFTSHFPHLKTLYALADQMNRSARSVKQNIVEGWKRNSTREYYEFLGFSIGSNAELMEDFRDVCSGKYEEKGEMGRTGERGFEIDKLQFYPLDLKLPESVKLFLKAKEVNFLLDQLQTSLVDRMKVKNTLSHADRLREVANKEAEGEAWYQAELKRNGLIRLANGKVVKK
jgi:four helix bundle protein